MWGFFWRLLHFYYIVLVGVGNTLGCFNTLNVPELICSLNKCATLRQIMFCKFSYIQTWCNRIVLQICLEILLRNRKSRENISYLTISADNYFRLSTFPIPIPKSGWSVGSLLPGIMVKQRFSCLAQQPLAWALFMTLYTPEGLVSLTHLSPKLWYYHRDFSAS